jgi:preprotein translocase subunit SecE
MRLARLFVLHKIHESAGSMARFNPVKFAQEVRQEGAKVTWPSRSEVLISTVMVLGLVVLASLFFLAADQIISWLVKLALSLR